MKTHPPIDSRSLKSNFSSSVNQNETFVWKLFSLPLINVLKFLAIDT